MKRFFEKAADYIKNNIISLSVILLVLTVGTVCLLSLDGGGEQPDEWPDTGLTEGIPPFDAAPTAVTESESAVAIYFSEVHREEAESYALELESELGVSCGTEKGFPKSFLLKEKSVTLHYNASTLSFSITVAKNISDANISSTEDSK